MVNTACLASAGVILLFLTNEFIIFPFLLSDLTSSIYALLIVLSTLFTFNNSAGLNLRCNLLSSSFVTDILYPICLIFYKYHLKTYFFLY